MPNDLAGRHAIKVWLIHEGRQQQWLAKRVGVSGSTLSRILKGHVDPAPVVARRLARLTGIDLLSPATPEERVA